MEQQGVRQRSLYGCMPTIARNQHLNTAPLRSYFICLWPNLLVFAFWCIPVFRNSGMAHIDVRPGFGSIRCGKIVERARGFHLDSG